VSGSGGISAEREARGVRAELQRGGGLQRTSESPLLLLIGPVVRAITRVGQPVCCRQWGRS